jgi:hypothetical protein
MWIPKGATHIHTGLEDSRKFEKWSKRRDGGYNVSSWTGNKWIQYDIFEKTDTHLISYRTPIDKFLKSQQSSKS